MQRGQQLPRQFTALQLRSIEDTVHFLVWMPPVIHDLCLWDSQAVLLTVPVTLDVEGPGPMFC